jgi:putative DNA primase/helicase
MSDVISARFPIAPPSAEWQAANPGWQDVPPDDPRWTPEPKDPNGNLRPGKQAEADDGDLITEASVADSLRDHMKDQLRYDHTAGRWYQWDETRWQREETKLVYSMASQRAREMAEQSGDHKSQEQAGKASFAGGVERLAQADRAFAVTQKTWDRNPWLLGTPGGVVDLRIGTMRPALREDYITKLTGCAPAAPGTPCPIWMAFLQEATRGDAGLIRFLQQIAGYCLTGDTREHALFFIYGSGGNGKGVFLNTMSKIAQDYAATAGMDTFTASQSERHPTDLAMLKGARMVSASETEEGKPWAESRIKQMTGGDPITARFMRQDFFTYDPEFKLLIIGNHKPALRNIDDAAKRRFNIVPFVHKPEKPDFTLGDRLKAEWPAILRWMIEGCLDWQAHGLVRPTVVSEATTEYFEEQNNVKQWVAECCDVGKDRVDSVANLFASWKTFATASGERASTKKWLGGVLEREGYSRIKDEEGIRGRGYKGLEARVAAGGAHHEADEPNHDWSGR